MYLWAIFAGGVGFRGGGGGFVWEKIEIDDVSDGRCRHITGLMDGGMEPKEATEKALNYMQQRTGETGGAITISNKGPSPFP